jgi:hypothetical protein
MYRKFLAAVRDMNAGLPPERRIRVIGGEPGPTERASTFDIVKQQVFERHAKALLIYGSAHFYLTGPVDYLESIGGAALATKLNLAYPDQTLVVIPIAAFERPGAIKADIEPDLSKIDRAIKTKVRPVLLPLQRGRLGDLTASEFLGRTLTTCRGPDGCRSVFRGSNISLGQMANAIVYYGR